MDADQKKKLVLPWDYKAGKQPLPARLMTANAAGRQGSVIGLGVQQEAGGDARPDLPVDRATASRDTSSSAATASSTTAATSRASARSIYGEPVEGKKFSLVFCGHHLTVRCDGNSEEATAFGGPLYYGHSPSGYARTNVFFDQTKAVTERLRRARREAAKVAVMPGKWKDEHGTIQPPKKDAAVPGLCFADMTRDQKELVEKVMKELVSPYRKEDGDEVMEIIKANGGMEKINLAFYQEGKNTDKEPWTYWRLEGPGFVWSFRALPHIHTFVYINGKLA